MNPKSVAIVSALIALGCVIALFYLSSCAAPEAQLNEDVVVSSEGLTTCWNTLVAGTSGGFPPFDVMTTAVALKQWVGGSWKPCTCAGDLSGCTCPHLVGPGRVVSRWGGCAGSSCLMTSVDYTDSGTVNFDKMETVWASDWDDDVYWHATTGTVPTSGSGTILVTLSSGNTWNVHHCVTQ